MLRSVLFAMSVVLVAIPGGVFAETAQSREDVLKQLKALRMKTELEQGRLTSLREQQSKLQSALERLAAENAKLTEEDAALQEEIKKLDAEVAAVQITVGTKEQRHKTQRGFLRERARALYKMHRRTALLQYLIQSRSVVDLTRRIYYLGAVALSDQRRLEQLSLEVQSLRAEQGELETLRRKRGDRLARVKDVEASLAKKRDEKAATLREVDVKEKQQESSLEKLAKSAESLERILGEIMGSEEAPEKVAKTDSAKTDKKTSLVAPDEGFRGDGLAPVKGKLTFPLRGKILQRFGKQKHEEFADFVFVKGLEFSAGVGEKVRPVYGGKVVLTQNLPGLGNVVIVDHGARYYTLYGRLATILCSVGTVVSSKDTVGVVGEPDHRGRNFYFELRFQGKAVDPAGFFKGSGA